MVKDYAIYKGLALAKGSEAYRLWTEKKWAELDKHMAEIHRKAVERGEFLE